MHFIFPQLLLAECPKPLPVWCWRVSIASCSNKRLKFFHMPIYLAVQMCRPVTAITGHGKSDQSDLKQESGRN